MRAFVHDPAHGAGAPENAGVRVLGADVPVGLAAVLRGVLRGQCREHVPKSILLDRSGTDPDLFVRLDDFPGFLVHGSRDRPSVGVEHRVTGRGAVGGELLEVPRARAFIEARAVGKLRERHAVRRGRARLFRTLFPKQ